MYELNFVNHYGVYNKIVCLDVRIIVVVVVVVVYVIHANVKY